MELDLAKIIQAYRNILDAQLFKTIELEIEIARLQQELEKRGDE